MDRRKIEKGLEGYRFLVAGRDDGGDQEGFSLIEVMIAICIISIGMLAVGKMQISGMNRNTTASHYTEYGTLAMEQIELMRAMPYDDLPEDINDNGHTGLFDKDSTADRIDPDPNGDYTIYTNVASEYLEPNTTTVSVSVVWNDRGMQRNVSLQGLIPKT